MGSASGGRAIVKIIGISGSLRKESFNTRLLKAAGRLAGGKAEFAVFDLAAIPPYNQDLDTETPPEAVAKLKSAIEGSDGILFATPEYNYGISGVLKNAIDWASRPAFKSVLAGKPSGILSASRGATGGARAQAQLKQVLAGTLTPIYPAPELLLGSAHEAFDGAEVADEAARKRLERYVTGYVEWIRRGLTARNA